MRAVAWVEDPRSTNDYLLPRSVLRWIVIGLIASSSVIVLISLTSGNTISQIELIGIVPFVLASAASAAKMIVQALRFRLIAGGLTRDSRLDLGGASIARIGSEFIALSTPATIGGQFVRAAWLSGKGMEAGRALWIGYFEELADIYVVSALALVAAGYSFLRGGVVIATIIFVVVLPVALGYTLIFLIPARRGIRVPRSIFSLASTIVGVRRGRRFKKVVQGGADDFSLGASEILSRDALPLVLKALGLTLIQVLLSGAALWFVLTAAGLKIDLLSSMLAICAVSALAALPVSIGGTGIAEFGIQYYLSSVYGFSSWGAVVLWRVASYQVVLIISGIALLLLVREVTKKASK